MPRSSDLLPLPPAHYLDVPVRPAVFKYLAANRLLENGNVFRLTKKNGVGRLLGYMLRTPSTDNQYVIDPAVYSNTVRVAISKQMVWLDGARHLTKRGIHDFNRDVEEMIEQEFLKGLDILAAHGVAVQRKAAALLFMTRYGFTDEDFTPDALIKAHQRSQKAATTALKSAISIPNCPAARVAA